MLGRDVEFLVRMMRVGADRAVNLRVRLGYGDDLAEALHARAHGDEQPDIGRLGARQYLAANGREVREIEVAVVIDEHEEPS